MNKELLEAMELPEKEKERKYVQEFFHGTCGQNPDRRY